MSRGLNRLLSRMQTARLPGTVKKAAHPGTSMGNGSLNRIGASVIDSISP